MFWNQAAKLHLFQLGNGGGGDADDDDADDDAGAGPRWSADEMTLFHAALAEHGKDFNLVAQRVSDPIVFFFALLGFALLYRVSRTASTFFLNNLVGVPLENKGTRTITSR